MPRKQPPKNPHAAALGRLGAKARNQNLTDEERSAAGRKAGLVGGAARAAALSARRRKTIARDAARARWAKVKT